jgi:exopolyphosphatase/guanosine-5'-triphosphate,3'-diphosphate pyrophosphatase
MTVASIDIGSNTVLLLIAKAKHDDLDTILNQYEVPRISRDLDKNGSITPEAVDRLVKVLDPYSKVISEYNCEKVLVNATNAMRIAANAEEIVSLIKNKFGYSINIISGRQEAYFSYLGATYGKSKNSNVVIDIGGGSTEIIIGCGNEIEFAESIPLGAVNLTEKHCSSLPPDKIEINNISREFEDKLIGLNLIERVEKIGSFEMTAVAGTPTTLSCINQNLIEYDEELVEGSELSADTLESIAMELAGYNPQQVLEKYGKIVKGREDVLLTGTIILKTITDFLGEDHVTVSGRGIRYGAVIDFINKMN